MGSWNFLTCYARVLLRIAHDPGVRLRDIAVGYVVKQKNGRRNRYQIQAHLPLPGTTSQQPAIGEVLALLAGTSARLQVTRTGPA